MKITRSDVFTRRVHRLRSGAARPIPAAEAAFTLVEVMIGGCLLAVMAVSLYGGISFGFMSINLARQNLRATQIALEKMEIVRMNSRDQITSNGFVPPTFTAPFFPMASGDTNGGLTYFGTTVITNITRAASYSNDMRQVIVTLSWTNNDIKQTLEMRTFISQYGMQRYIY